MQQIFAKIKLLVAALIVFGFAAGAVTARAVDRDDRCEKQVRKAEQNLDKAVRKHGEHSRQAEQRRHDLEEARERCHHDHDRDHDHDHDHDRH